MNMEYDKKLAFPNNLKFKTTDIKLHVSVVTLSTEDDKLLEQLKTGFK